MLRSKMNRRELLKTGSLVAGLPFLPFFTAQADQRVAAYDRGRGKDHGRDRGYGPLIERPKSLLHLPAGFEYYAFSPTGAKMSDGRRVPGAHDGMRAFDMPGGIVRLIRNHELSGVSEAHGPAAKSYDPTAPGAVTVVDFDPRKRKAVHSFLALSGTIENCAGGYGGRKNRSWLSCEESTEGFAEGYAKKHGYVFEVPANSSGLVTPVPLKAMGRFVHEAAEQDPKSGIVYLTEDEGPDGFYRFLPNDRNDLSKGGSLWMLAVDGVPGYDTATGQTVGAELRVHWVRIDDPDPEDAEENASAVLDQGVAKGGAIFSALEGLYIDDGIVYFSASDGGDAERGQIWQYTPTSHDYGKLRLVYESADKDVLDGPDNICVSPRGSILIAEDGDGGDWIDGDDSCRQAGDSHVRFVTPDGVCQTFARVPNTVDLVLEDFDDFEEDCTANPLPGPGEIIGASETCGVVFSPDGKWLFLNIQVPGITLAITGPWHRGGL
jgi:secreted PhoX family phosphatase